MREWLYPLIALWQCQKVYYQSGLNPIYMWSVYLLFPAVFSAAIASAIKKGHVIDHIHEHQNLVSRLN